MKRTFGPHRSLVGVLLSVALPVALTGVLLLVEDRLTLSSEVLLFVLATVVVSIVGGLLPALAAAVVGSMLLNWFFTPPVHALTVRDPDDAVTLVVFVLVALLVSSVVALAARRTREAAEARATAIGNTTRSALLAAVGHDLRTPLAAAKASVSSLRGTDVLLDDADRRELLATADESLDRLTALVEDLLDLSRLRAGAMPVLLEPTPLADVVARVQRDAAVRPLEVEVPDDLPDAEADPRLLERVVANLVGNAHQHAPGSPVRVVARAVGERLELQVVDAGPGVAEPDRERIFEPFQRLGDNDNSASVGLGLALSRGLVEGMAGTLRPQATPGGGLTMVVTLPAATPAALQPGRRERATREGVS